RRRLAGRRQARRLGMPVLRRRLSTHLPRRQEAERHQVRYRQGRPVEPQPPVRERALRLRLRGASAAPDEAAHPKTRPPEVRRLYGGPGQLVGGFSGSNLGGSAGCCRFWFTKNKRSRPIRAGWFRFREGL